MSESVRATRPGTTAAALPGQP
ncbi:MAG: hypothetical protein JWP68_3656, partial [Modestobacter sp.]|nr:hypothetical protein [Modestobacter sp.]